MSMSQRSVMSCLWSFVAPRPVLPLRRLATWLAVLIVFVLAACPAVWAAPVPWPGNGHWYEAVYVGPCGITRTNAQNAASDSGGYLASCTSAAENDFVYSLVSGNNDFWFLDPYDNGIGPWLGGYYQGGWKWVTGEPWSYANWTPLHPAGSENFMGFLGLGTLKAKTWANFFDNQPCRGYIVERDTLSEPGTAYFSLQGTFVDASDVQDFHFVLVNDVPSDRPFELRTLHSDGGQNAAGETIPGGGFNPILTLTPPPPQTPIVDDDGGPGLDSLIDHNTSGVPDPLPAGNYDLRLDASGPVPPSPDDHWAVDLVGPSQSMVLTGLSNAGSESTVTSLKFGSPDAGTATLVVGTGETLEFTGPIVRPAPEP